MSASLPGAGKAWGPAVIGRNAFLSLSDRILLLLGPRPSGTCSQQETGVEGSVDTRFGGEGRPGRRPSWCRSCHGRPHSTRPDATACLPALVCVVPNPAHAPVPGRSNPKEEVR